MSNTFFVSDTHFGHDRIRGYSNRPFSSVEEMDAQLIKNWNAIVQPEDVVWHLGDFAFLKYKELKSLARRLNGNKNLILGNHDKEIISNMDDLLNDKVFNSIQYYTKINVNGQKIVLLHYGMRVWDGSHKGAWQLFGHSHNSLPPHGKSVDVGVDSKYITEEYRPVSFHEVRKFMDKQIPTVVDHHGMKEED